MQNLSDLLRERFKNESENYNFDAVLEHSKHLVDLSLENGGADESSEAGSGLAEHITALTAAVLHLQAKLDGLDQPAREKFASTRSLSGASFKSLQPAAAVTYLAEQEPPGVGLSKLEKSKAKQIFFRWMLGGAATQLTFRVKNTGKMKLRIGYVGYATGVSSRDLNVKLNGNYIGLRENTAESELIGSIDFPEETHSNVMNLRITSERFQTVPGSPGVSDRKLVVSIAYIILDSEFEVANA